jgi:cytochrome c
VVLCSSIITVLAGGALSSEARAEGTVADGAALYQQRICHTCHGADGNTPLLPMYPKIAGQNAEYALQQMLDIKNGVRTNGQSAAMRAVMQIVSEEELKVLAEYLATLE